MRVTRTLRTAATGAIRPAAQAVLLTAIASASGITAAADLELAAQQPAVTGMSGAPSEGQKPFYKQVNGKYVYIVRLDNPAVAAYRGGIKGYKATSPQATGAARLDTNSRPSRAYAAMLAKEQASLMQTASRALGRALKPRFTYQHAFNGVAVALSPDEAKAMAGMPGVRSVQKERQEVLLTDDGPIWIGAPAIWDGTPGSQGEGAVIGVLDTGINFDHPSFADIGGDGYDHTNPLGSGNYLPGSYCDTDDPAFCNDKLIGAWSFVEEDVNYPSPNDSDNHGSHTASTAAGNVLLDATVVAPTTELTRAITGVAPHANIIAYDVCVDTCPGAALVAAMDQIIIDAGNLPNGIQALNYSISGGVDPYSDAVELAFLNANAAGIYPSVSAGNSGPGASTTGHNSPWTGGTAASTHRRALNGTVLDLESDGAPLADLQGATFSAGYGPASIVYALNYPTDNGTENDTDPAQCLDPFPPGTWSGEIVLCDRGTIARVDKGANVLAGGAGGFVLANTDGESVVADGHFLPAVHIGEIDGDTLRDWLGANTNTVATLSGTEVDVNDLNADIMAGFSSRGPNATLEVIKPDVSGPGVNILAAFADGGAPTAPEFGIISGTSMSSPHHAGSAALISQLTDWTPSEIKSALMMTAVKPAQMLKEDGVTTADAFDAGGGRINLNQVLDAGLVMNETQANYEAADPALGGDPKTLNIASMANHACVSECSWTRTVRNVSGAALDWQLSVADSNGVTFSVVPDVLSLDVGAEGSFTVTADTKQSGTGFTFSEVELVPGDGALPSLHMPIAVLGVTSTAPELITKTVDLADARPGDVLSYEISAINGPLADEITIVDVMPAGVSYVDASASAVVANGTETSPVNVAGDTLSWSGLLDVGGINVVESPAPFGYFSMASLGVTPFGCPSNCDDGSFTLGGLPPFEYGGETYTEVIWSVNGTVEVGTASGAAASASPSVLPNPNTPNNVLAPLWADLNLDAGGEWYVAVVTAGPDEFIVFEWEDVPLFGDLANRYTFQVWIVTGTDLIWYAYAQVGDTDIPLVVGAENIDGTAGDSYYASGDGTPPAVGVDLAVVASQGGSVTINFQGEVDSCEGDAIVNEANLSSGAIAELAIAATACDDEPLAPGDIDRSGHVNIDDVNLVLAARNTPADGPDDPRDMNGDGVINMQDARLVVNACDEELCALPPG